MNVTFDGTKPRLTLSRLFAIVFGLAVSLGFLSLAFSTPSSTIGGRAAATFFEVSSLTCSSICAVLLVDGLTRLFQGRKFATPIVLFVALVVVESTRVAGKEFWSQYEFVLPYVTGWAISGYVTISIAGCLLISIGKKWINQLNVVPKMDIRLVQLGVAFTAWHIGAIVAPAMVVLKFGPPYFPT